MREGLTTPEFIEIWNASDSVDDFCAKAGMKKTSAGVRASNLRTAGHNVKLFGSSRRHAPEGKAKPVVPDQPSPPPAPPAAPPRSTVSGKITPEPVYFPPGGVPLPEPPPVSDPRPEFAAVKPSKPWQPSVNGATRQASARDIRLKLLELQENLDNCDRKARETLAAVGLAARELKETLAKLEVV